MKEFWNVIQMVFTAVGGWLGYFLGGNDGLLIALVVFAVADYITGVMCAVSDKKLNSQVGFKGICRKVAVQKENYAVKMYKNVGFKTVDENAEEYIMVCEL